MLKGDNTRKLNREIACKIRRLYRIGNYTQKQLAKSME